MVIEIVDEETCCNLCDGISLELNNATLYCRPSPFLEQHYKHPMPLYLPRLSQIDYYSMVFYSSSRQHAKLLGDQNTLRTRRLVHTWKIPTEASFLIPRSFLSLNIYASARSYPDFYWCIPQLLLRVAREYADSGRSQSAR